MLLQDSTETSSLAGTFPGEGPGLSAIFRFPEGLKPDVWSLQLSNWKNFAGEGILAILCYWLPTPIPWNQAILGSG